MVKNSFFQRDTVGKVKIFHRGKGQLIVLYQVVTDPCCGLSVIFCGFISHLIGRETINIPENFIRCSQLDGKDFKDLTIYPDSPPNKNI